MEKIIMIKPMECAGCRTCEMICSTTHYGMVSPVRSNIRVVEWLEEGLCSPLTCLQCDDPLCMKACPVGAISRDEETGAKKIDEKLCVGCKMCVFACPVGGTMVNPDTGKAIKCDLCGGDPKCVKWCPTGAIKFVDAGEIPMDKKKAGARFLVHDELVKVGCTNENESK